MSDKECRPECVVGEVCLSIGDGGTKFRVLDCGHGPQIEMTTSSFGNGVNTFELFTTHGGIVALAKLFQAAAEKDFSQPYRYSAYPVDLRPATGGMQVVNCCQKFVPETKGAVQQMCVSPDTEVFLGGSMQRVDSVGERQDQGGINEP